MPVVLSIDTGGALDQCRWCSRSIPVVLSIDTGGALDQCRWCSRSIPVVLSINAGGALDRRQIVREPPSSPRSCQAAQFSMRRPATRLNSRSLLETRTSLRETAWAAINVSSRPIGVPARSSFARTPAYAAASPDANSTTLSGRRKFSTRRSVFVAALLLAAPRPQLRLGDDADRHFRSRVAEQPLEYALVLFERINADIGVQEERHPTFGRQSASPCAPRSKSSGTPANDST